MEPLTSLDSYSGYRHVIIKRIPGLDFPHWEHSIELLNVPFAPFSRFLLHTFTLWRNFEPLTFLDGYLGYSNVIIKQIPGLDSPYREHSIELLNVPFAPFSRFLLYTFTLWRNFEPLTFLDNYSGYRHVIIKRIPGLDSPYRRLSFEPLNVPFAPFSRFLLHTFTLWRNFEPLTSLDIYSGYRHAIIKRIPGLYSPYQEHSFELLNVQFAPFSRSLLYSFTLERNFVLYRLSHATGVLSLSGYYR